MNLSDFKLLKEDDNAYEIAHPSGKKMSLAKKALSSKAHELISALKPKKYGEGGEAEDPLSEGGSSQEPTQEDFLKSLPQEQSAPVQNSSQALPDSFEFNPKKPAQSSTMEQPQNQSAQALPNGFMEQQQAAENFANAVSGQGRAEVAAHNRAEKEIKDAKLESAVEIQKRYAASDAAYKKAIDESKIDPNRFWHDKSVPAKIGASLGLLLSGIGSGLSHQQNMAQQFIQKAIDNDIEAQKSDQSKVMNAWKMNREAMGSDIAANIATRQQAYIGLSHQLDKAASQFKGPMAQANYLKAKGMLDQEMAMNRMKLAALSGPTQETAGGASAGSEASWQNHLKGLQAYFPEYYKDLQAKYQPGVGIAQVPLSADDRTEYTNYQNLDSLLGRAASLQKEAGDLGLWSPQKRVEAEGLKRAIATNMGTMINSKRPPTPELLKTYEHAVGGLGNINFGSSAREIKDLQDQLNIRKSALSNGLGMKHFMDATPSTQYKISDDKVKYVRGANGKAVPAQ